MSMGNLLYEYGKVVLEEAVHLELPIGGITPEQSKRSLEGTSRHTRYPSQS